MSQSGEYILYRGSRDELNEMCRVKDETITNLVSTLSKVLEHVEDGHVERIGNQCTLCAFYRRMMRDAIEQARPSP